MLTNVSPVYNTGCVRWHEAVFFDDKRRVHDDKRRVKSLKNQAHRPTRRQRRDDKRRVMFLFSQGLQP